MLNCTINHGAQYIRQHSFTAQHLNLVKCVTSYIIKKEDKVECDVPGKKDLQSIHTHILNNILKAFCMKCQSEFIFWGSTFNLNVYIFCSTTKRKPIYLTLISSKCKTNKIIYSVFHRIYNFKIEIVKCFRWPCIRRQLLHFKIILTYFKCCMPIWGLFYRAYAEIVS